MKFLPDAKIARQAVQLLRAHEACNGAVTVPPVPVERIVEDTLDLQLVWQCIPEAAGQSILGALVLDPDAPKILFNESRLDLFESTPGLYQTTLAHEAGHWLLHAQAQLQTQPPLMPELGGQDYSLPAAAQPSRDPKEVQAHKFMSFLLMPDHLLRAAVRGVNLQSWPQLYDLRAQFQVTVSALRIRLEMANLLYVSGDKQLFASRQAFQGQIRLPH